MTNSGTFTLISPSFNLGSVTWPTLDSKINFQRIWVSKVTLSRNKLKVQIWDKVLIGYVIFFSKPSPCHFRAHFWTTTGQKKKISVQIWIQRPKISKKPPVEFFFFKGKPKSLTSKKSPFGGHTKAQKQFLDYIAILCVIFCFNQPMFTSLLPHISKLLRPALVWRKSRLPESKLWALEVAGIFEIFFLHNLLHNYWKVTQDIKLFTGRIVNFHFHSILEISDSRFRCY